MTADTKTTLLGGVMAAGIAVVTFIQLGFDPHNPVWWAGMVIAAATGLKGYYTNKAT